MLGYFGIFTFLGLGSIIEQMTENKRMREKIFIFSLLLLILFFGLRGYIGYDWYSYKPNFDVIPTFIEIVREIYKILILDMRLDFRYIQLS